MEISNFGADDSFHIWGNDNATLESGGDNEERPGGIDSRLNREWYVQENAGAVGTVSLTFDISLVSGPTGVGSNNLNLVRLMTDPIDSDFTSGVTITAPTSIDAVNNTVTFEVALADATYFTLGSTERYALPITLIHFDAEPIAQDNVRVEWTTVEEIGNAYFSIERSADGINFETIAQLDGAGNSDTIREYQYIDQNPVNGQSFYRLRQTDFNGTYETSEVVRVLLKKEVQAPTMSLYPNPARAGETLSISYKIEEDQYMRFSMISADGHITMEEERFMKASEDNISLSTQGLSKGLHILRVIDQSQNVISLKILIQ
jgi:hypothetical protein